MTTYRWTTAAVLAGTGILGGCQLLSGLGGLHADATSSGGGGGMGGAPTTSSSSSSSTSSSSSSSSGSCTADLMIDVHNCGACNHDCGEGNCILGQCGAYDLYTAAVGKNIVSLASNGTYVFWSEIDGADSKSSAIARMPIDKSSLPNTVVMNVDAHSLATDGNELFWWDKTAGQIEKSPLPIGMTQLLFAQANMPAELRLQGSEVLWSDNSSSRIYSGSKTGTPPAVFALAQSLQSQHFGVDAGYVYWSDGNAINKRKRPLDMAASPVSIGVANAAVNVLADTDPNGYVYFGTSGMLGGVFRLKKDGSTVNSNAGFINANYTDALLMDGAYLYWTNYLNGACTGGGTLGAKSLTIGTEKQLATVSGCGAITQDADAIYFVDAGTIRRVVKPAP